MHTLVLVAGRTGVGKTTIVKQVARELNLKVLASYTTRPKRTDDVKDIPDHIFVSKEEFDLLTNKVAYTQIGGYEYCCTEQQLQESDIYIIDPLGIKELFRNIGELNLNIACIYITCGYGSRLARFLIRDDNSSVTKFQTRDNSENDQFDQYEDSLYCDYIIENIEFNKSVELFIKYYKNIRGQCKECDNNACRHEVDMDTSREHIRFIMNKIRGEKDEERI